MTTPDEQDTAGEAKTGSVRGSRPGAVEELRTWARHDPHRAALFGGLVALLLLGTAGLAFLSGHLARRNSELRDALARAREQVVTLSERTAATDIALIESETRLRSADESAATAQAAAEHARRERDNLLRLSASRRLDELRRRADALWPAEPALLAAYDAWLEDAGALVAELEPAADGTHMGHRRQLELLSERAQAYTAAEAAEDRRTHPRAAELERLRARLAWMQRAESVRRGASPPGDHALYAAQRALDARHLEGLAWPLVDPDRLVFGREAEGLALARTAVTKATGPDETANAKNTLAWALLASGLDDEALMAGEAAIASAREERKDEFARRLERLGAHVAAARDPDRISAAEDAVAALTDVVEQRRTWRFENAEDAWWHGQLSRLVAKIEAFANPVTGLIAGISPDHGWGVARRRDFASTLDERTRTGERASRLWADATASIADRTGCPFYDGLQLPPQRGLLPVGRDPATGLWEFWHAPSGDEPVRGENGRFQLTEDTGIVLVLVPGGRFLMGAQQADPERPNFDRQARADEGPVHEVTLPPHFLSKYELTQGQWQRLTGGNPSNFGPAGFVREWNRRGSDWTALHPVEQVSWNDAERAMTRAGLALPTEAQWEHACRAGTTSAFWTGDSPSSLEGAANLADAYGKDHGFSNWTAWEKWLDDGWAVHAPVGGYGANAFGLHDVHGNVWEWCRDAYEEAAYAPLAAVDPVRDVPDARFRLARGGSFASTAASTRAACRNAFLAMTTDTALGLRPARSITP